MAIPALVTDGALGAVAGVVASRVMTPVTSRFYQAQSEASKQQETDASYGVAYEVAVRKTAGKLGVTLGQEQASKGGAALHYGLGVAAAPAYMLLRRRAGLNPWLAGLLTGVGLYVTVDEAVNPLLGFTPPPTAYPAATHLRGLVGHVVLGLALAATVEVGWALLRRRP